MDTIKLGSKSIIAALDIGSTKVSLMVAESTQDNFKVIGKSLVKHDGVRQGAVVNINKTFEAIKKAKREAELNSGHELKEVYVSVGGLNIRSFDSNGMAAVEESEVSYKDIAAVLKTSQAIRFPEDREVLHILPKEYILDGQGEIQNPIGMKGVRLEADVHLITGISNTFSNTLKCVELAGLKVKEFVLQQYASSFSTLGPEEKDLGVCLVEIGGGTCEWIVFEQGMVVGTGAIPLGGSNLTNDISIGLRTPTIFAERIKTEHGHCKLPADQEDLEFEVEDIGGRGINTASRGELTDIITPRSEEILKLIIKDIERAGFLERIPAGIVLTGGASQIPGLTEFGTEEFNISMRLGKPLMTTSTNEVIDKAEFSCSAGLLKYARLKSKALKKEPSLALKTARGSQTRSVEESFKIFGKQFKEFIGL